MNSQLSNSRLCIVIIFCFLFGFGCQWVPVDPFRRKIYCIAEYCIKCVPCMSGWSSYEFIYKFDFSLLLICYVHEAYVEKFHIEVQRTGEIKYKQFLLVKRNIWNRILCSDVKSRDGWIQHLDKIELKAVHFSLKMKEKNIKNCNKIEIMKEWWYTIKQHWLTNSSTKIQSTGVSMSQFSIAASKFSEQKKKTPFTQCVCVCVWTYAI